MLWLLISSKEKIITNLPSSRRDIIDCPISRNISADISLNDFIKFSSSITEYFSLNTGLILRIVAEPQAVFEQFSVFNAMLLVSALLQSFAAVFYVREMWPRLVPKRPVERKRSSRVDPEA